MTQSDELGFPLPPPAKGSRVGVFVILALVVGAAFTFGYVQRRNGRDELSVRTATASKPPRVEVIKPAVISGDRLLALPGTVWALEETGVYALVSGYVRAWYVDIGDKVKAGQLLAELDTPEVMAQLAEAQAHLAQARTAVKQAISQRDFSQANTARFKKLGDQALVAQAQVEQNQAQAEADAATVSSAQSNVAAQAANVRRLAEQKSFARLLAPFAGTVTTRSVARGMLVRDGNPTPLFTVVAMDPVRVFVDVPQTVALSVRTGMAAKVTVREYPGRVFEGKVARSAGALDPAMHTMRTEIQVPNADGALLPGMYVEAGLALSASHRVLELPATAIYSDAQGVRIATIDNANRVHFVPIKTERDTGATIQIAGGLTGEERVIKLAVPSLVEGDLVEVAKVEAAKTPAKDPAKGPAK